MSRTQRTRVLRALEHAGSRGITSVDFQLPDVIDGGAPILRVAARIEELVDDGYRIVDHGKRDRCKVYALASTSEEVSPEPLKQPSSWDQAGGASSDAERLTDWWACMSCGTRTLGDQPVMDCCDEPVAITFAAVPSRAHAREADHDCARCDAGYTCAEAA